MTNNSKIHLIPQAVISCVEGLSATRQEDLRLNYIMRLEAIREYCDTALNAASNKPSYSNNKSKSNKYSRIGLNNV